MIRAVVVVVFAVTVVLVESTVVEVLEPLAPEGAINMSLLPFVSFATRFVASESKAINAPSDEMKGR